ncbi:MAG TPA: ribosome maturation factor RimM [Ktedonobacteraceae bacterium]|nr:ribosome maturation factor RimM [Ktedonobacteraceae bacterium]
MPEQSKTEWATIGTVVAPLGVRGELKVRSLTDIPDRFVQLSTVSIGSDHISYRIKSVRPYKGELVILKLEGVDDANTAETLRNFSIQIPVEELAKLPPDSYYQHEIIGLQVLTMSDQPVGTIVDIMQTGSNDVYDIRADDGSHVLIPAIKDVIKQVDLVRQTMYIEPIPGLLNNADAILVIEEEGTDGQDEEDEEE